MIRYDTIHVVLIIPTLYHHIVQQYRAIITFIEYATNAGSTDM